MLVLVACGPGYRAATGQGAGSSPRAALAEQRQDNAEAARAAAALQRRYRASTYAGTRSWQSANALGATIDFMRASGSRGYLADLRETYRAHHGRDNFRSSYYDDEGWWALTWINAYDLTGNQAYLGQARDIFADMTGGILQDPCEPSSCDQDEPLFKGIFMTNLKFLADQADRASPAGPTIRARGTSYRTYLRRNAVAVWSRDRRGDEFGLRWSGPFDSAGTARQTSALDLLNTQVSMRRGTLGG